MQQNVKSNFKLRFLLSLSILFFVGCSEQSYVIIPTDPPSGATNTSQTNTNKPPLAPPSSPTNSTSTTSSSSKSAPPVQSTPLPDYYYDWEKDKYPYDREFYNRCAFPRTAEHKPGTVLDELFAIREIIDNHYLFRSETVDLDPRKFVKPATDFDEHYENMTNKDSYLQQLRTFKKRPTGELTHGMHQTAISVRSQKTTRSSNSYKIGSYGIEWRVISDKVPRDYRVEFTEPNTPASVIVNGNPIVKRGDKLLKLNDFDFVALQNNNLDQALDILFRPKIAKGSTKFVLLDRDTKLEKTVMLRSVEDKKSNIFGSTHDTESGKVGYLLIGDTRNLTESIDNIITSLKAEKVKDLILDIRYLNTGERYPTGNKDDSALAYMIAGFENTDAGSSRVSYRERWGFSRHNQGQRIGQDVFSRNLGFVFYCPLWFSKCSYLSQHSWDDTGYFNFYLKKKYFNSLELDRVYILVSRQSCRVAETLINGLRGVDIEVILVGEPTCGYPYSTSIYLNCGIIIELIDTRYKNNKGFGNYEEGFKPSNSKFEHGVSVKGCYVENDLTKSLGDVNEPLFAAALQYRKDSSCPPVP